MEAKECIVCRRPKLNHECGVCLGGICKKCAVTLEKDSFSFLATVPTELSHKYYCGPCYDEKVAPELQSYTQTMARMRRVIVFMKGQGEETRLMNRKEKPIRVDSCEDKEETLLRLAFIAVRSNCNGLLDVEINPRKVKNAGYSTTLWTGVAIPTHLDEKRFEDQK